MHMADPLSIVIFAATAGGAAGGAAGKMLEKAWESSERWIATFFANHRKKALEAGRENAAAFLGKVGEKIADAEATGKLKQETIESAMDHPEFAALLQQAVIGASQTDSPTKHRILASLVADRLAYNADSAFAVSVRLASQAVALATTTQLRVLGLVSTVRVIRPTSMLSRKAFAEWLAVKFRPFEDLEFTRFDLMHLEAIDCVREHTERADLMEILHSKVRGQIHADLFLETSAGKTITKLWRQHKLDACSPTSIGLLVGLHVADELTGSKTAFEIYG
jgi:hypothetical protein